MKTIIFLACCVGWFCSASCALAKHQSILVIQSYHQNMPWTVQCENGIRSVLGDRYQLHYFYMDTKRLPQSQFQARTDAAWAEYLRLEPALVMLGDDNALRLLGPLLARTDTPTVYFGINNNPRSYFDVLPVNMTGALERLPLFPWIRYLKRIMPQARRALFIMDTSPTTDAILSGTFKQRTRVDVTGIETQYRVIKNWEEWQDTVGNLQQFDLLVMPTYHTLQDKEGKHIEVDEVVRWTSANSPIPLFSFQDYAVGEQGAVGSYVVFGETQGRLAGEMAIQILGEHLPPKSILPVMGEEGLFYFNKQQLARFNLVLPEAIRLKTIFK